MIGKTITWTDNWNRWYATIEAENGNCYFLENVKGYALGTNDLQYTDLQYTGRDKGNVIHVDTDFVVVS